MKYMLRIMFFIAILLVSFKVSAAEPQVVEFFNEDVSANGGFSYGYPSTSYAKITNIAKIGKTSILLSLDTKAWAGVGIGSAPVNLKKHRKKGFGTLVFYIKGNTGKEKGLSVSLVDSAADGAGFHTDLNLSGYCKVSDEWQLVSVPLADFGDSGTFWDESAGANKPGKVNWADIAEVSFYIGPMEYEGNLEIFIDDLKIIPENEFSEVNAQSEERFQALIKDTSYSPAKKIGGKNVMGYFTSWNPDYNAENIPYDKLTHIFHAFLPITEKGDLVPPGGFLDRDLIIKARENNVKVIVSIGGGGGKVVADKFVAMASSKGKRKKFAANCVKFCRENGYDGVDIDWEYPANEKDRKNEVLLAQAVREAFNSATQPGPNWLITKAATGSDWMGKWCDYDNLSKYMDFYNIMTYDYYGEWNEHSGHNSPLYSDPVTVRELQWGGVSCAKSIEYIRSRGVPDEKINLGLAFYGNNYSTSEGLYGDCEGGCKNEYIQYFGVLELIKEGGWVEKWDDEAKNPYLLPKTGLGIVYYDNERSLREKVKYTWREGLNGVFIWEISGDFSANENKLLPAVYEEAVKQGKAK